MVVRQQHRTTDIRPAHPDIIKVETEKTVTWPTGEAALVTGAASGIGFGDARALVAAGAKVALGGIDEARLAEAEESLRDAGGTVLATPFDSSDTDQWGWSTPDCAWSSPPSPASMSSARRRIMGFGLGVCSGCGGRGFG
ncbi:SDR family NAD(P)-dependent oxidoreductase [Streptomyces sp. NPDC057963]|uniref:SDR family NAD(P)-dependent oxidoreductase n=1 Tax=Streptomyces sp. NPDC057963 TaxID=3346290 RepID=UPI0036E19A3D